jgi:branched-chain amino acid transport system permease protein
MTPTRYGAAPWYVRALVGTALLGCFLTLAITWIESTGTLTDKRIALTFLINLVIALGIQVFMGNSGVVSFGHVAFVGIAAYAGALLTTPAATKAQAIPDAPSFIRHAELPFLPATLLAVLVVAAVALVLGLVFVRLSGAAAAIATLGLLVIVRVILSNWESLTRGAKTFYGVPAYTTVWWALGWAIVAILVARTFRESGTGLRLRATRDDPIAAGAMGADMMRSRLAAWVVSAAIAGVGGVLYAHFILGFAPEQFFFDLTFTLLVMVVLGGPTVSGAVVGATAVTIATEVLRRGERGFSLGPIHVEQAFGLTTIGLGVAVLGTMILRQNGLLGRWELDEWLVRAWARVTGRRAQRRPGREGRSSCTTDRSQPQRKDEA